METVIFESDVLLEIAKFLNIADLLDLSIVSRYIRHKLLMSSIWMRFIDSIQFKYEFIISPSLIISKFRAAVKHPELEHIFKTYHASYGYICIIMYCKYFMVSGNISKEVKHVINLIKLDEICSVMFVYNDNVSRYIKRSFDIIDSLGIDLSENIIYENLNCVVYNKTIHINIKDVYIIYQLTDYNNIKDANIIYELTGYNKIRLNVRISTQPSIKCVLHCGAEYDAYITIIKHIASIMEVNYKQLSVIPIVFLLCLRNANDDVFDRFKIYIS